MENFMKVRERLDPHRIPLCVLFFIIILIHITSLMVLDVFRTDFHYDVFDRKLPKVISPFLNILLYFI